MKIINPSLKQALAAGTRCYLVKITAKNGDVFGFTNHDKYLTYESITYKPAPGLENLDQYYTANAEVSSANFDLAFVDFDEDYVKTGVLDNSDYQILVVAYDNLAAGHLVQDKGKLFATKWDQEKLQNETMGFQRDIAKPLGVQTSAYCWHDLGDDENTHKPGLCGVDLADFTVSTVEVTNVDLQFMEFSITSLSKPNGFATNGRVVWTTGNNQGLVNHIKVQDNQLVTLSLPTNFPIQVGDTCNIIAGCNKTMNDCKNKFNNVINFGGTPFINTGISRR